MREPNPQESLFRRQMRQPDWWAGGPTQDKVLKSVLGWTIGFAVGAQVTGGMPETLNMSRAIGVNVPLIQGAMLGIPFGFLAAPVVMWITRENDRPRFVFWGSLAVALGAGAAVGWLGWLPYDG